METRPFGRTGHASSVAIFGGFALSKATPGEAFEIMEQVQAAGVNHIDIAPTYGQAEERLGPWLQDRRGDFFLGCKTTERSREGALQELRQSLARLRTDHFDLYQIHAITSFTELDQATGPNSALEGIIAAREAGLTRHIGITGHGHLAPEIFLEALRRFEFDSVLFPVNFVLYARPEYRSSAEALLAECQARGVGVMAIKALAARPWGEREPTHITWYEPFTQPDLIQEAVNFSLSQPVTGLCTAGDPHVLPMMLDACQNYRPIKAEEQQTLVEKAAEFETIF